MLNRRTTAALFCAVLLAAALVPAAVAATVSTTQDYVVKAGETVNDDVYAFADTVTVEGTIRGDLVALARKVIIAEGGKVEGDLMAAGAEVRIEGKVTDDVRAAAYQVSVEGSGVVGDDMLAAGYSVETAGGTTAGGDVLAMGYQGRFDGIVDGDVEFAGAALEINGQVAGDVRAEVAAPADKAPVPFTIGIGDMPEVETLKPGLSVGDAATIEGSLVYTSPEASELPAKAAASTQFHQTEAKEETTEEERSTAVDWLIHAAQTFVALLVFGVVVLLLVPRAVQAAEAMVRARPAPSAGWGCIWLIAAFLGFVALVVVSLLALFIVVRLHIGPLAAPIASASFVAGTLLTAGLYLLGWVARIVVALWIGRRLARLVSEGLGASRWLPLLIGVVIYTVLWSIPYVGSVIDLIGIIVGLGGILYGLRALRTQAAVPPGPVPEPALPA